MASLQSSALLIVLLASLAASCQAGVNITSLPISIVVSSQVNGVDVTSTSGSTLVYLQDTLTVEWHLNASFVGQDSAYSQVQIRLCYGYPSLQGRIWRAPNTDLSLAKNCLNTPIAVQAYNPTGSVTIPVISAAPPPMAPGPLSANGTTPETMTPPTNISVPGNMTMWQAGRNVPGALYYVRVFVLNSTASGASPANNAVAMGQTTNANSTTNLFQVIPYGGTTITLDVTIIVLSVAAYVLLFGYFFYERWAKKNK